MSARFRGVWAAAITPLRSAVAEPDLAAALDFVDYLNTFPIDGIALAGSTGEFVHFDVEHRIKLIDMCTRRSRKPVLAGVSHSTLEGTVRMAGAALDSGAAAVLVLPPHYFRYGQGSIRAFYLELARQLGPAPLFLYNIPFFASPIGGDTAAELLETGLFAGIKDSSGDIANFERIRSVSNRHLLSLIVGNDAMYAAGHRLGADGLVSGIAAMAPEIILSLQRALDDGRPTAPQEGLLRECMEWLDRFPVPVAIKLACGFRGLHTGTLAVPLSYEEKEFTHAYREWFADWMARVKLLG